MEEVINVKLIAASVVLPIIKLTQALVLFKSRAGLKYQVTVAVIIFNNMSITHCNVVGSIVSGTPLFVGLVVVAIPFKDDVIIGHMIN